MFRCLATMEGTLTGLAPHFDLVAETRRFAADYVAEQLHPDALRRAATEELTALIPVLRRLPRRIDRISASLETGRLGVNVRLLADDRTAGTSPALSTRSSPRSSPPQAASWLWSCSASTAARK